MTVLGILLFQYRMNNHPAPSLHDDSRKGNDKRIYFVEEYSDHNSSGGGDNAWFVKRAWKQREMVPCSNGDGIGRWW